MNRIKLICKRFYRNTVEVKLLRRLIIGGFIFLIIPVLIAGIILFSIALPLAQNEARDSMIIMVSQLNENIQYRITGYQNISTQILLDLRLTSALTREYSKNADAVSSLQEIDSLLDRIYTYFPMKHIRIYQDNPTLPEDLGSVYKMSRAYDEPWYANMQKLPRQRYYWYFDDRTSNDPVLHLSVWLTDFVNNENYGIIKLEIPCNVIFDHISIPMEEKNGWLILINENRQILMQTDNHISQIFLTNYINQNESPESNVGWLYMDINQERNFVVHETNDLGWTLFAAVNQEDMNQKIRWISYVAILISILFVFLSLVVLVSFGKNITRRLNLLLDSMREMQNGSYGKHVKLHGDDELALVEREFNAMSENLYMTINDLASARSWAEKEELRLLQAQINPHFLYNTLSLVKYMAMDINANNISIVIDAMSRFFRLALNHGSDFITIKEEIEHVKAYFEIHQLRYPGKVSLNIDIDQTLYSYEIIKMTLQPIVENTLTHAFVLNNGCGKLAILNEPSSDAIVICVVDNGCGMPQDMIDILLNHQRQKNNRISFGLNNVHERLKKQYGVEYGLSIESVINQGTTVKVKIPIKNCAKLIGRG